MGVFFLLIEKNFLLAKNSNIKFFVVFKLIVTVN